MTKQQTTRIVNLTKPDVGGGVSHPARYSKALIPIFAEVLRGYPEVLDPFAGTGLIHRLQEYGFRTTGVEIEPEWASLHPDTRQGDALSLPFRDRTFDAICSSPCYGNRLADSHKARDASLRRSYTHDLGRKLADNNAGALHWGPKYREFHEQAWLEALRVLRRAGRFVLNIKDHIRAGERQYVAGWHVTTLSRLGLDLLFHFEVETPAMRRGANRDLRLPEQVYVFEKVKT